MKNPTMTLNPYTNQMMNVEPFLKFWSQQIEANERIESVIRTLVLVLSNMDEDHRAFIHHGFELPSEMYQFLYDIKDMFDRICECEISNQCVS